jgi:predicted CXXCH cytochrome family protein
MKAARLGLLTLVAVTIAIGMGTAYAFHDGGVAECIGCHSMHTPQGPFLLNNTDRSSTCLSCHEGRQGGYRVSTAPADMPVGSPPWQRNPGGDFGWLKKTYTWSPPWGGTSTEDGWTHGHNIIAADFGYVVDPDNSTAPGGSGFPSGALGCEDCHDPHGSYGRLSDGTITTTAMIVESGSYAGSNDPTLTEAVGVYRLMAGPGYSTGGVTFGNVPAIVAPDSYNRTEATTQTRVAYGDGIGDWCATCHPNMHSDTAYVHPIDVPLGSSKKAIYDQYRGSGDMSGTNADSYLSLVPFEENIGSTHALGDYTTLKTHAVDDGSQPQGPTVTGGEQVTCLSCHRAHASGFEYALRWNPESEFIIYNGTWPGTDVGSPTQFSRGRTYAEYQGAMYEYPEALFATYQRSLCNKCHAKD